jgi:hypothetical protein
MDEKVNLANIYVPSDDVAAREIQGEFIIIPVTSGASDFEDAIFTLNDTGRAIWDRLDGKMSLEKVVENLSADWDAPAGEIEKDVIGLMAELLKRKMLVEVPGV